MSDLASKDQGDPPPEFNISLRLKHWETAKNVLARLGGVGFVATLIVLSIALTRPQGVVLVVECVLFGLIILLMVVLQIVELILQNINK